MPVDIKVNIKGLPELERKLDGDFLVHPAVDEAVQKIMDRPLRVRKRGQGAGIRNNALSATREGLSARVQSTLRHPRRTGAAWTRYNIAAMRKMAPNVLRAAARRIEGTFGA